MSDQSTEVVYEVSANGPSPSLAARASHRREMLLEQHSIVLEVPGYEGVLAVEYRAVGYPESKRIHERLRRIRDEAERELYVAADHLLVASTNSFEMSEHGSRELGHGWGLELARELGIEIGEGMSARQAVLACFPREQLLLTHFYVDYSEWLSGATLEVDSEQARDFPGTTSPS